MRPLWLALCGVLTACATWSVDRPLATGTVVETRGEQSYTVYLPRQYTRARRWPVIFGFSPIGRGADVTDRLADAAEKYGYILIASNVSKNGDLVPTLEAQDAMWRDAHTLLAIDEAHLYATGFSGGARVSLVMAQRYPLRGIIACGAIAARVAGSEDPTEAFGSHLPHVVINNFGDADMNAAELHAVAAGVDPQRHLFWSEEFVGPHAWPSQQLYSELLELLELDARRQSGGDAAYERSLAEARIADARQLLSAGEPRLARLKLAQVAQLFPASRAEVEAVGVGGDPALEAEQTEGLDLLDTSEDRAELEAAWLRAVQWASQPGPLQRRARAQVDGAPWRAAFRALRAHERAAEGEATALIAFAEAHVPEASAARRALAFYNLARAQAQLGRTSNALGSLRSAVDAGYRDRATLEADPAFRPLRNHPGFAELVSRL